MNVMTGQIDRAQLMVEATLQEFRRRSDGLLASGARGDLSWETVAQQSVERLPRPLALTVLRECATHAPGEKAIWGCLAECHIVLENTADAEMAIESALQSGAPAGFVHRLRATLAERRDRFSEALDHWKLCLQTCETASNLRALARCYENSGAIDKAVSTYEQLIATDKAQPVDHYEHAVLDSLNRGVDFRPQDSEALQQRYSSDAKVAARHAELLDASGLAGEGPRASDAMPKTTEELFAYSMELQVRRDGKATPTAADAEAALEHLIEQPKNVLALENCTMLLAKSGDLKGAKAFLARIGNGEASGRLAFIEADLEDLSGNPRRALTLKISAARLCDRARNLAGLCRALYRMQRWLAAERVLASIKQNFSETLPGLRILMSLTYDLKDFPTAADTFDRVQPLLRRERSLHSHAGALWQIGETGRAWSTILAIVTKRRALISSDPSIRQAALAEVKVDLDGYLADLEQAGDARRLAKVVRDGQSKFRYTQLHLLKSSSIYNERSTAFLQALTRHEAAGELKEAGALIEKHLPGVIGMTSLPQYCGDLYYRASRIFEALGKPGKALHYIEQALWYNKADEQLLLHHRRILQQICKPLKTAAYKRPAVLILTWSGNLERAERLADDIATRTGLLVFTLYGNPNRITHRIEARSYGHRIIVPSGDGYESLAKKLLLAYRFLFAATAVTSILKIDDDGVLDDPEALSALLHSSEVAGIDYGGRYHYYRGGVYHHGHLSAADQAPARAVHGHIPYCGGFCYYLSRKSLGEIYRFGLTHYWVDNPYIVYEDVYFGEMLSAAGIEPTFLDVLHRSGILLEAYEPLALKKTLPLERSE